MSIIDKILHDLKNTKYPLYLFGKGTSTKRIIDYLRGQGVSLFGVLVNRDWYRAGENINGVPTVCFEEFLEVKPCEILICTGDWKDSDFPHQYKDNIKKIHAYDFWGLFAIGEWNLWDASFLDSYADDLKWIRSRLCDQKSLEVFDENWKQRTTLCYSRMFDDPSTQYLDKSVMKFTEHEVFIDCGAYHGENLLELNAMLARDGIGEVETAFEIEADARNVQELEMAVSKLGNVSIISKGVWDKTGSIFIDDSESKSSKVSEREGTPIEVISIDDLKIKNVTFIKMDVEGAELPALKGAEQTIKNYKPKLAISVYHRPEDFIQIPRYIDSLGMNYEFYLRCYSQTGCETILYAV